MNTMSNPSNLHAANATSVLGTSVPIPIRSASTPQSIFSSMQNRNVSTAPIATNGVRKPRLNTNQGYAETKLMPSLSSNGTQMGKVPLNVEVATKTAVPASNSNIAQIAAVGNSVVFTNPTAPPSAPNSAGANALNLSGRWSLDREDSDSINDYLEAMGLPLIARQAADKLDLMVIINQTPGDFMITRRARIFMETKHLKFGQEVHVKNNAILVTGDASQIKTVTRLSNYQGVLTDQRTLDERGRMKVELTLLLPERPAVTIRRYFVKTSDSTSLENLPPFDISAETSMESKRKR